MSAVTDSMVSLSFGCSFGRLYTFAERLLALAVTDSMWEYSGFPNITNDTWADYDVQYLLRAHNFAMKPFNLHTVYGHFRGIRNKSMITFWAILHMKILQFTTVLGSNVCIS